LWFWVSEVSWAFEVFICGYDIVSYCSGITGANDRDLFTASVSDLVLESREVSECASQYRIYTYYDMIKAILIV